MIYFNLFVFLINIFFIKKYLHIYQLKDYQNSRYLNFFTNKSIFYIIFNVFLIIFHIFNNNLILTISILCFSLILSIFFNLNIIKTSKTPLKITQKVKILYVICVILMIFFINFDFYLNFSSVLLFFLPIISNFLNFYSRINNSHFIESAQKKLKLSNVKIIAITGSNGKTSVKNILLEMLSKKFQTQATPKSFNTPLGISKFINDSLKENCEYLILEYGARRPGDIKKLCKLFGADFGIITTIAPQHLETFKSIETITETKGELSNFLNNKLCVFNLDNPWVKYLFDEKRGEKISISTIENSQLSASNIRIENFKTHFTLLLKNQQQNLSTKLLGKHNVTNILLATALAIHLGVEIESIIDSIKNLQPTPHRLELIQNKINILDDSYNCSLESAKEAIWTLNQLPQRHFVATPGIIECGKDQYLINLEIGKILSKADIIIIIGKHNKKAILDGLKSQNFNFKNTICVDTLNDAKQHFSRINVGETLLLLNDLPDDYN